MMATARTPRRYAQLKRVHATAEVLRQCSIGWPLDTIRRKVGEVTGEASSISTTQRDLAFLELLGLAEHVGHGRWRAGRRPMEFGKAGAK